MNAEIEMVREFFVKHSFPQNIEVGADPKTDLIRVHLIGEEGVAELALALAEKDKVRVADALADLLYVTLGAAIVYGIPLKEVFEEVHKSNMTKDVRDSRDSRIRNKGANYKPADIQAVLNRYEWARWRLENRVVDDNILPVDLRPAMFECEGCSNMFEMKHLFRLPAFIGQKVCRACHQEKVIHANR